MTFLGIVAAIVVAFIILANLGNFLKLVGWLALFAVFAVVILFGAAI